MDLQAAMLLLKNAVKFTGVIDQKHIDLSVVPAGERKTYEQALMVSQLAIKNGEITKEVFLKKLSLD